MSDTLGRNLAVYVPVVLPSYALAGVAVDALTGASHRMPFPTGVVMWAAVGWWVPILFLPAALVLLALASWLPARWSAARRRAALLVTAPPLFAAAMFAGALATTGDTTVLRSPYLAIVVVPALAYAAAVRMRSPAPT
jgi:hypothetical protein